MKFGDAVKRLRAELGLTQMELANALHVNFATIGRWEKGKNLPTRAISSVLIEYARSESASAGCVGALESAFNEAAREKLGQNDRASLSYSDRIADVMNSSPGGIAVVEADSDDMPGSIKTVYYNEGFYSYSGYEREEYDKLLRENEMYFVFEQDREAIINVTKKICDGEVGETEDVTVRCRVKGGSYKWILLTAQLIRKSGSLCVITVILIDITKRKTAEDKLRISEEMFRAAAETDNRALIIYDIKKNECRVESHKLFSASYGDTFENVPESLIEGGIVAPEYAGELRSMFEKIKSGESRLSVSLRMHTGKDEYEWFECNASAVTDADGKPDRAVLAFHNITEQRVKEAVFSKWQQSIKERPEDSYTLFRCNLSRDAALDEWSGKLLKIEFAYDTETFGERTRQYTEKYVYPDDREKYLSVLDTDTLISMFLRDERSASLDYREICGDGVLRWRHLTVETVRYPDSPDIQAFLMYEDNDEKMKALIKERELIQTDPLTGVLNRVSFSEKTDSIIRNEKQSSHALFILDADGFKRLNDSLGHAAGDRVLADIASIIRSLIGEQDLVCRLGGDEFLVLLKDIPDEAHAAGTARRICGQVKSAFENKVGLSVSIGIALYPRDGDSFDSLYVSADKALYRIKRSGKNNYAFFSGDDSSLPEERTDTRTGLSDLKKAPEKIKHRILIADGNAESLARMCALFSDEYTIETAGDETETMNVLRRCGSALSVVLLDTSVSGGIPVLEKIQETDELCTVPVIIISEDKSREAMLGAFVKGAADYIVKPADTELIRIKSASVIKKVENERSRAQNSYLHLQRDEEIKFRTVLESTETAVIEYDIKNRIFRYDGIVTDCVAGRYDKRSLWDILVSDSVASPHDVKELRDTVLSATGSEGSGKASKTLMLRTPSGDMHWFRVNAYRQTDESGNAEKLIITFNDVHEEVLSNEKLMIKATRDDLTGLYNRAGFIERAEELIASKPAGYYVMACIDIDRFKVINDQYGTRTGDEILKKFGSELAEFQEKSGGVCCRVTADNFATLFPASLIGKKELEIAHKVMEELADTVPDIKFSIGRCIADDFRLSASAIYDRAAIAKETVKGRFDTNVAMYNESMRTAILRMQEITGQMKQALSEGQFEVWLQPQFNHCTRKLSGAEALVRWNHPKEGIIISPAEFIPIFERNGFVYELDKFVWEKTCALLRKWLDMGLAPVPVSVNVSRYDVFRDDLIDTVTSIMKKYSIPSELLRLEITESAFSESAKQIIRVVEKLISLGFIVEIDDFGSGYSSLNTLKDVPAQVLKMDMRFLENDSNAQRGGSIIESVVRMAKWLGMTVIAEGVETIEQADYLKSIGCEYIQGYLYSRPVDNAEYEKIFARGEVEVTLGTLNAVTSWDNNAFWNPKSIESLIFNSYVGGACIFEYYNGKTELLRTNDDYVKEFRGLITEKNKQKKFGLTDFLSEEDYRLLHDTVENASKNKKEESIELPFTDGKRTEYIRLTVRLIASAGTRLLFYAVVVNMTERRITERKQLDGARQLLTIMKNIGGGITAAKFDAENKIEILFANDGFYDMYGYTRKTMKAEVADIAGLILEQDRQNVLSAVEHMMRERGSGTCEYRCRKRNGEIVWTHAKSSVISLNGAGNNVILTVLTDVTAEKEANLQLGYLNSLAHDILAQPDSERAIRETLTKLTGYHKADRSYVVEFDYNTMLTYNTYEVCAEGINSEKDSLQAVPFDKDDFWYKTLVKNEFLSIESVPRMTDEQKNMREMLNGQGIQSMFLTPLWRDGVLIGFAGVDNPREAVNAENRLKAIGDYIAILLTRRDLNRDIERSNESMHRLMDDTPGGFCRVAVYTDRHPRLIGVNKGFCDILGMTEEEVFAEYGSDMGKIFRNEDIAPIREDFRKAFSESSQFTSKCRLLKKDGSFVVTTVFGRFIDGENMKYLNAYFAVASDNRISFGEMLPIALSTMLHTSDDVSFIKDRGGKYLACSKAALRAFGLSRDSEIIGKTGKEIFGEGYTDQLLSEDLTVTETGKPLLDRVIKLKDRTGRQAVYSTSKFPLLNAVGDVIGIYTMCRDITAEKVTEFELKTLLRVIPSGVIKYAADENGEIEYINRIFIEGLGYTGEQFAEKFKNRFSNLIWKEDRERAQREINLAESDGKVGRLEYRIESADGSLRWFHDEGVKVTDENGREWYYVTLVDITDQKETLYKLRLAEEEYRLATEHNNTATCRYSVQSMTLSITPEVARRINLPETLNDVPYGRVKSGRISPDTADDYIAFYESIRRGEKEAEVTFQKQLQNNWRWIRAHATTIFGDDGKPVSAVISYSDVTEEQKKEAVYKRWEQSMKDRAPESYTLFRCNLNKNSSFDSYEGSLIDLPVTENGAAFNDITSSYAGKRVAKEDAGAYIAFVNYDTMMAEYYRGHRSDVLEYREITEGGTRWIKLTVDLVQASQSKDIEAFLLYENIDAEKRGELETIRLAKTDPLTGLYNRKAFTDRVDSVIASTPEGVSHLFVILDIDVFKSLNDTYGHAAGDEALVSVARKLRELTGENALISRIGGDEFTVFLSSVSAGDANGIAEKICRGLNIKLATGTELTASVGASVYPEDGRDSHTLYQNADAALYSAKEQGRNTFRLYKKQSGK